MIKYHKKSLFDVPKGSYLVHAANTEGYWGKGIAAEFKKRFPESFQEYTVHCKVNENIIGSYFGCSKEKDYKIVNLFTSSIDSRKPNDKEEILVNTTLALDAFLFDNKDKNLNIYSNKFNSGLFNVPWHKTEEILKVLSNRYNVIWNVTDPDMDDNYDGFEVK